MRPDPHPWHLPPLLVAIPVKDEAQRIGDCLRALARQRGSGSHAVLLLLNNCTDGTEAAVRVLAPTLPLSVHVVACTLAPGQANAGHARRAAMQHAARLLPPDGLLLTTDADGRVAPDWIAATRAAFRQGAEAVAGQIDVDPTEAELIPAHLQEDDALECAYGRLLDEIDALLDPVPCDPWPHHAEHSGASIAVTLEAYRRAGGIPDVPLGEDRAFFAALRAADARIRHAMDVRVTVSARIDGRAVGGMADTIRRRMQHQDPFVDERLEPAWRLACRAALRARLRTAWAVSGPSPPLAGDLQISDAALRQAMKLPFFGAAWQALEGCSAVLVRHPVARADLAHETHRGQLILDRLRRRVSRDAAGGPAGNVAGAAAASA